MTYIIIGWVSATIGFVLGTAWTGLCIKNRKIYQQSVGQAIAIDSHSQPNSLPATEKVSHLPFFKKAA